MSKLFTFFVIAAGCLSARVYTEATNEEAQWNTNRNKRQFLAKDTYRIRRRSHQYFEEHTELIQDGCQRDEARYIGDGQCYKLLAKGPCAIDEFLILSRSNNSGVCEPRLCLPDRIFIPDYQLCFDFRDPSLCPPGREPRVDPYGYPVCQCKFGTFDVLGGGHHLEDNSCAPILSRTSTCSDGKVLWSKGQGEDLECLPDPCRGDNLRRGHYDKPLVPLPDGRCFPLGSDDICPPMTWYSLALDTMRGECSSLEDSGYEIVNQKTYSALIQTFGLPISREFFVTDLISDGRERYISLDGQSSSLPYGLGVHAGNLDGDKQNSAVSVPDVSATAYGLSENHKDQTLSTASKHNFLVKTDSSSWRLPLINASAEDRNEEYFKRVRYLVQNGPHNRNQRQSIPVALPNGLITCGTGLGGKCKRSVTPPIQHYSGPTQPHACAASQRCSSLG